MLGRVGLGLVGLDCVEAVASLSAIAGPAIKQQVIQPIRDSAGFRVIFAKVGIVVGKDEAGNLPNGFIMTWSMKVCRCNVLRSIQARVGAD